MKLRIESVRFKRSENTPEEAGIAITAPGKNERTVLVDMLGKLVSYPLWTYNETHELDITYVPETREVK